MISKNQLDAIAAIFSTGILLTNEVNFEFMDMLNDMKNKCQPSPTDDRTTSIFKTYIRCGGMTNTIKYTHNSMSQKEISDTLFYKQSNDIYITLLAKLMYSQSGTKRQGFLNHQIDIICSQGYIDIKEEYIKWEQSLGCDLEDINGWISGKDSG